MASTPTLGILFYIRNDKQNKEGLSPIYLRITVNGQRAEISLKRSVDPAKWNSASGNVKGTKEEARELNEFIDKFQNKVYKAYQDILSKEEVLSAESIKNKILGNDPHKMTLLGTFDYHNTLLKERVNIEYAPATIGRFETTYKLIQVFIKTYYKNDDILLKSLDHQFIANLERYFKVDRLCNHNTTMKYIMNVRKVVNLAINNDWLDKDPFRSFKIKIKEVDREFLSQEELLALERKEFNIPRLDTIRDTFVFACYTGFAYADVARLTADNISIGIDGEKWLYAKRKKTQTKSNVLLLPKPLEIIEKYKDHPEANYKNTLLPVCSNQKVNAYLKEIADLCGIKKNLTFHMARHTFATTVTLTNGVPIESVSRMLGHKSIRTTQIYAKVIERKVSNDMLNLRNKLNPTLMNTDSTKQAQ